MSNSTLSRYLLVLAALAPSCVAGQSEQRSLTPDLTFDSTRHLVVPTPELTYELSGRPIFSVGAGDSRSLVRVVGLGFARNKALIVADGGTYEISVIDSIGRRVGFFGRKGAGPGDFQELTQARISGDTIMTWDSQLNRITWFSIQGKTTGNRAVRVPPAVNLRFLGAWLGVPIFSASGVLPAGSTAPPPDLSSLGAHRDTLRILAFSAGFENPTVVAKLLGQERFVAEVPNGQGILIPAFGVFEFTRSGFAALSEGVLAYGSSDSSRITIRNERNRERVLVSWSTPAIQVTRDYVAALRTALEQNGTDAANAATIRLMEATPKPETLPRFDRLFVSSEGYIWIREVGWPTDSVRFWKVIDSMGRPVFDARLPSSMTPVAAIADRIAVLRRDSLHVQYVDVYALRRAQASEEGGNTEAAVGS